MLPIAVHDILYVRLKHASEPSYGALGCWYIQVFASEVYPRNRCDEDLYSA